jgi:hypothetical protein
LQSNDQLLKFVSREDFGLSGKSQGLWTPASGVLRGWGKICHTRLALGALQDRLAHGQSGPESCLCPRQKNEDCLSIAYLSRDTRCERAPDLTLTGRYDLDSRLGMQATGVVTILGLC